MLPAFLHTREIEEIAANLSSKGLLRDAQEGFALTATGNEQADILWQIAHVQQEKIFADC